MQKAFYSIGLFCSVLLIGLGFYASYQYRVSNSSSDPSTTLETDNPLQSDYYIEIHEGTVLVRLEDGSVYETTDISWDSLPSSVQKQIEDGFVLKSKQELYSFLEAYSS